MHLMHVSSLSHGGGSHMCGVHLHVRERKHAFNIWCIFFVTRGFRGMYPLN